MNSAREHRKEQKWRTTHQISILAMTGLCLFMLMMAAFTTSSCGGGSSLTPPQNGPQAAGNWQFTLTTSGTSFAASPLEGGFLLEQNGSITGQIEFSILSPSTTGGANTNCNSGIATVTGTTSGQSVNLTATIGSLDQSGNPTSQTIALSGGALSANNSSMQNGTYSVTPGYAVVNGQLQACGTAQDAGNWSASLVPPLTGGFQGFFHSTTGVGFANQSFPVSGTLSQGPNIGAASATVTGTLLFEDPVSLLNDYPCLSTASVNGTISGNSVLLQIFSTNGTSIGQIGQTPGSGNPPTAVTFDSTQSGYIVHNLNGATAGNSGGGYVVTTKSCPAGDSGNLCLALGGSKACNQPITLTPFSLSFPPQLLGSAPTTQTFTLTNNSSGALSGLQLGFAESDSLLFYASGGGDFNGVPSFTERDNCTPPGMVTLNSGASCTITVSFSPQESCPWLPQPQGGGSILGLPPAMCPLTLTAALTVDVPSGSADADSEFSAPVSGTGLSLVVPSVPEIDFGWEALGESSDPKTLTFTNQSPRAVTLLPAGEPCIYSNSQPPALPRPPVSNGQPMVSGLQVAETASLGLVSSPILSQSTILPPSVNAPTVDFFCDTDPPRPSGGSGLPNIQISHDECSGQTLAGFGQPGNSCSVQVTFVPQPSTWASAVHANLGLDDFLQLNSMWCGDANNPAEPSCEIDSGRFSVEIKTNPPSPLRMFPSAGMDFGTVVKGTGSNPLSITLFNDPEDPSAGPVTITAKLVTGADYLESDNCPPVLASNQSCTVTVIFTPSIVGLDPGKITFTYNTSTQMGSVQTIYLRGTGM
jgi:hypothetical protein